MTLSSGTKLGPYEIISTLGAGGMGEVYRARDTRLDREVAVKILPSHPSENAEAKQRFDREARTISSLNHPNICTLYDVGHQNGIDFLVMEYLEGETLADRLRKGPLPIEQVLKNAIEICDGLDKAHRSGVVHRDLKPGNIMLTKTGAKLMDFGLAKAAVITPAGASSLTVTLSTPVASHPLTAQGAVVGTFQYMAPEQVEGKEADARSDIFALGAVLYEMATGKRAFEGKTAASAMAAVLEREPASISSVQPMTPPAFERLVKICLAKDPDERWQTVHDVKLQLREIAQAGSQPASQANATPLVAPARQSNPRTWLIVWAISALVGAAVLFALYTASQRPLPIVRTAINPPVKTRFNLSGDNSGTPAISPDGRYIVFGGFGANGSQLYLRGLDDVTAHPLPGTEGGYFPFWSPDSRSIAFFTFDKLKRIDLGGSQAVSICDASLGRGGAWNRDGMILAALYYNQGIFRVPASGGSPTALTKVDFVNYSSHRWPFVLPDGKHFLYLAVNHDNPVGPNTAVFFASIDGSENRLLFSSLSNAIYAAGRLLYIRDNTLMAQPFDPAAGKFTGEPKALQENVQYDNSVWRANLSVTDNGMMVYVSGALTGTQSMTWYDRSGKQTGTVGDPGAFQELELSPDDKQLVVTDANSAAASIWLYDLGGKPRSKLTYNSGVSRSPVWSPDGHEIAFTSHQQASISTLATSGGTPERILLSLPTRNGISPQPTDPGYGAVSSWSHDGKYLLYDQSNNTWALPMSGDKPSDDKPSDHTPIKYCENCREAVFSPNGRWVAYVFTQAGQVPELFVAPFPWTGARWQVSQGIGSQPRWRADGKELYYYDLSQLYAVEVEGSGSTFQVGNSTPLFHLGLAGLSMEYSATRDGQRFIAITPSDGNSQQLTLVQNWTGELKSQ
jgi:eukaryotic-like serine/threonine-protein kinase